MTTSPQPGEWTRRQVAALDETARRLIGVINTPHFRVARGKVVLDAGGNPVPDLRPAREAEKLLKSIVRESSSSPGRHEPTPAHHHQATPKMTPAERAATFGRIINSVLPVLADPDSPAENVTTARATLGKVVNLLDALHGIGQNDTSRSPEKPSPHVARAHARKDIPEVDTARLRANTDRAADGLHGLRKGRRQCEATTRSGARCKAPAVLGGSVCKRHGGSAPQVKVSAAMMILLERRYEAGQAWEAARGTPDEFGALCKSSAADRAVQDAEARMERLRELRAELRKNTRSEAP